MKKLVIFKLNGNLRKGGFDATIEVGLDGDRASLELEGKLPENPELADAIACHWEEKYRPLGMSYRIKPGNIIYSGSIHRVKECQTSAAALRDRVNRWLKSESFQNLNLQLRSELNREDEIRILLRTNDPLLHKLPWHKWDFFDSYSNAEIAFSSPQFIKPPDPLQPPNKGKVKILVILGHSERINVERDREILNNLDKNRAEVKFLNEPDGKQINDSLWEQGWDIIFFAGHSETVEDIGRIYINPTESLTFERDSQLWYGLRKAVERGLKLAIFNSCDGLGLAKQLDDLHIPQMIVMRDFVADLVAQEFLKQFLKNYISGQPLYLAAREAREFLQGMEEDLPCASWLPVIWQNPAAIPPRWDALVPEPPASPSRRKKRSWRTLLFASLVVASLVLGVRSLGWLQPAELKTYDQMMRLRPDEGTDRRLLIVEVTEDDLTLPEQKNRKDSLSDLALSKLIEKLEAYEPRAIGLNIIRDFPVDENVPQLREQFQQNDRVYGACRVRDTKTYPSLSPPPDLPTHRVGFIDDESDSDGVVRRHLLFMDRSATSKCQSNYEFSVRLAWHYLKQEGIRQSFQGKNLQLGQTVFKRLQSPVGAYQKADTRGGQILLNYRPSEQVAETVTLENVLRDSVPAENVRDRIVLIGANNLAAPRVVTPYQAKFPVVRLQAHAISQILNAVLENRPLMGFLPRWCDALWIFVWSGVGGALAIYCGSRLQWRIAGGLALTILWGASNVLLLQGFWVPLIPAVLGLGGASVLGLWLRQNSVFRPSPALLGGLGAMLLLHILLVPSTPFLSGAIALATAGTATLAVRQPQRQRLS
ncbi:CHASE2 domain-containing protein [Lusitaniella coriacea]|uniref:CHASE2 domain-containing protein n=1 Tax=Lusitaniella coriacea TaxID=1983105 RepID=UPI003CEF3488